MPNEEEVKRRVKVRLATMSTTAAELCRQHDVDQPLWHAWVNSVARGVAGIGTVQRVADMLGVSMGWLLGETSIESELHGREVPNAGEAS